MTKTRSAMAPALPNYEYELFISYAHGPVDEKGWGPLRTWSTNFKRLLSQTIEYYVIASVRVCFDGNYREEDIDPHAPIDDQLRIRIARSALLQVHMGDWYLKSRWCERELDWWMASLDEKVGAKERRISVIRVAETDHQTWPASLQPNGFELPGVRCHDKGRREPWGLNQNWGDTAPTAELGTALTRSARLLADRIVELRDDLVREQAEKRQVEALRGVGDVPIVYLYAAEQSYDVWREVSDALAEQNIEAHPTKPPPRPRLRSFTGDTQSAIASRSAAMIIIASEPDQLSTDLQEIGHEWRQLVIATYHKTLPCAVLDRHGIATKQLELQARRRGIAWIDATDENWVKHVQAWLKKGAAASVADRFGIGDSDF